MAQPILIGTTHSGNDVNQVLLALRGNLVPGKKFLVELDPQDVTKIEKWAAENKAHMNALSDFLQPHVLERIIQFLRREDISISFGLPALVAICSKMTIVGIQPNYKGNETARRFFRRNLKSEKSALKVFGKYALRLPVVYYYLGAKKLHRAMLDNVKKEIPQAGIILVGDGHTKDIRKSNPVHYVKILPKEDRIYSVVSDMAKWVVERRIRSREKKKRRIQKRRLPI